MAQRVSSMVIKQEQEIKKKNKNLELVRIENHEIYEQIRQI